ncbi:glycosyltransferase family 1 protein [Nocardiopsis exhalans]|uniref:Glycosyltransferase family 1 protein n=1 Tax=Nocardiopsis exhalans TaxID=163604 RepID=A0ABY5DGK2_9ACTN|nr:glycosyltransferase family 1 protein [Nocardiopsis exhalans]USY23474.1 glycosyltransferase family 1 protein [Nocardiopsis exhalans]
MRLRSFSRQQVVLVAVAAATVAVALSPPRLALTLAFAGLAVLALGVATLVERQRHRLSEELGQVHTRLDEMTRDRHDEASIARERDVRVRQTIQEAADACADRTVEGLARLDRKRSRERKDTARTQAEKRLHNAQDLLWTGYSSLGLERLRDLGADAEASPGVRAEAHKTLSNWHRATGTPDSARDHAHLADLAAPRAARGASGVPSLLTARIRAPRTARHFDVVLLSDFGLPGGSTGSNLQEITAQRRAGLSTGLVHHPVAEWGVRQGVNPKVMAAVDNDRVRFIAPDERVTCDLMIVRVPRLGERPMDVLPSVEAAKRIVVLNQTPDRRYGVEIEGNEAWNVGRCVEGFTSLLGEHTWHPISPRVREAMVRHHAAEMAGIPLAEEDWTNIIDLDAWRRPSRRAADGRVLLGRHSRDHRDKWPDKASVLAAVYPALPGWETHVLGGAKVPEHTLGVLPDHWTVHDFDTVDVREFLHGLDAYVYFTGEGHLEPFGRSPLEAMAVGLPTLLPESFRPVFGDAALYTDPAGVREAVEALMGDEDRYSRQVRRGHEALRERFSHQTHLRRLARLGVRVPAEFLEVPGTSVASGANGINGTAGEAGALLVP